jgi:membrane-bound lytic murein transglycosylase D
VIKRAILLIWLLPSALFGALTFDTNYANEVRILRAFDVPVTFLNDPGLQQIIKDKRKQYAHRHFFKSLDDAYLFIPMIKEVMADSDVPSEFLFLAMAESDFSLEAYSHKKAMGLWQFMPKTGRRYGLQINDYVDERKDLVKSTEAAVKYLDSLHRKFGKWYLAAIAYNCGGGRLSRAIKRAGTDNINVLLNDKYHYLPAESRRYIRKIIALTLLASDEDFMINQEYAYMLNRANAYSIARVKVARGERLSRVAKLLHIPTYKLTALNRYLNYDFVPPTGKSYEIYIPYVKLSKFRQVYKPEPMESFYVLYKIKHGDTLSGVGKKYRVSYKMIRDFNHLSSSVLHIGQKLVIPVTKKTVYVKRGKYTVKSGDSLTKIARKFETTVSHLKKINHLVDNTIRIGDRLSIDD